MIPALSVIPVATKPCTSFPATALFTPSAGLLAKKTLSVGHTILWNGKKWQTIPVANLSLLPVWLEEGSTLGTIQPYTNEIVQCDWNKTPLENKAESSSGETKTILRRKPSRGHIPKRRQSVVYKPIRKKAKSDKLLHKWVGPFIVVRQTTPVNYEVKLVDEKTKSDIVHVASMKPFKEIKNWRKDTNSQTEAEKNNRPHQ
ncbi:Uncharacterized protein APZ42_002876 [Daphnia magna]|uniref:Integrase p58-like C-terminal domain-containing protein n=1 Tax=Daphnia magna TaxID=35525 RepID=A0A164HZA5_9CRUS|nr:Uncharacterized protein APZ42_002876 [Daphnia magna]